MKKYLMIGLAALAFASCSKNDFETYSPEQVKEMQYADAFEKQIGKPAANQTWGDWKFTNTTKAITRGVNDNGNIWFQNWERPYNVNLSDAELEELKALLSPGVETYNTYIFPYENYYIEQIYTGESTYNPVDINGTKLTGTTVTGSVQMNQLGARNGDHYEHSDNFNAGNNTAQQTDEGNGTVYKGITLMYSMSKEGITATNQFRFHETWGTKGDGYYNNYLIVEYKGEYYVGFDYEAHKDVNNPNEARDINRDWKFTDWIVRISPAEAKETPLTPATDRDGAKRIMCEDLGAIGDFDFNDVVFDVWIGYVAEKATSGTVITIQCAGGTLPLTVAGVEIHGALGYSTSQMVNTGGGEGSLTAEPYTFFVEDTYGYDAKNVPVVVTGKDGSTFVINAETGEAPQKFCVNNTSTKWATGRTHIYEAYPDFSTWATNPNEYNTPWTTTGVASLLY